MHADALASVERLDANGHECVVVPQVLYEYWVVATRPPRLPQIHEPRAYWDERDDQHGCRQANPQRPR